MPSKKIKIWETQQFFTKDFVLTSNFCEVSAKSEVELSIIRKIFKFYTDYQVYLADEIDEDWIDENLAGLDLFGRKNILILQGEKLNASCKSKLLEVQKDCANTLLLLSKSSTIGLENSILIDPPMFWEWKNVFSFFTKLLRLNLEPKAFNYVFDCLEPEMQVYYSTLKKMQVLWDDKRITEDDVRSNFESKYVSNFEYADMINGKKLSTFWQSFSDKVNRGEDITNDLNFLLSHLTKIYFFTSSNRKMSRYEKEIEKASDHWSKDELISLYSDLEKLTILNRGDRSSMNGLINQKAVLF